MLRRSGGTGSSANASTNSGSSQGWQQQQQHEHEYQESGHGHSRSRNNSSSADRDENLTEVDSYFANLFVGDEPSTGAATGGDRQLSTPTNDMGMHVYPSNDNNVGTVDTTSSTMNQNQHHKSPLPSMNQSHTHNNEYAPQSSGSGYGNGHDHGHSYKKDPSYGDEGSPTTVNRYSLNIDALPVPHSSNNYSNGNNNYGGVPSPPSPPRQQFQSMHHAPQNENRYAPSQQQQQQQSWQGQQQQQQQQFQHNNGQYPPQQHPSNSSGYGHSSGYGQQFRPSPPSGGGGPPLLTTLVAEPMIKVRNMAMSFFSNQAGRGAIGRQKKQDDDHDHNVMNSGSAINETLMSDNWMSGLLTAPQESSNNHNHQQQNPPQRQNSSSSLRAAGNTNSNGSGSGSSTSSREGMAMVGLVLLLFVGMNMSSLMTAEQNALSRMRNGRGRFGRKKPIHHEEGMDRPNSMAYIKSVRGRGWGSGGGNAPAPQALTEHKRKAWGAPRLMAKETLKQQPPPKQQQPPPQVPPPPVQQAPPPPQPQVQVPPPQQPRPNANNPANFAVDQLMTKAAPPPAAVAQPPPQQPADGPPLPPVFDNIANVGKGPGFTPVNAASDIPMFWHIPKAGGSSLKEIFGTCMGFTLGCELGGDPQHASATELQTFEVASRNVVNIDFYNPQGIEKARSMNVASSGKVDVLVSPYLHQSASLFTPANQGRLFTLLRHPIDRALSSYGMYVQMEKNASPLASPLSLIDYAMSNRIENNWMTRFLSGKMSGPLQESDLDLAKHILKTKFIVGLLDQEEEFLQRLNLYFGWNNANTPALQKSKLDPSARHKCIQQHLAKASPSNQFSKVATQGGSLEVAKEGSQEYNVLMVQNSFDMQLYDYSKELFKEQRSLFV